MRNPTLRTLLRTFADEAAGCLGEQTAAGVEVPFEVSEQGDAGLWGLRSGRTPLYCYRPLTGAFIAESRATLTASAGYAPAVRELEGLDGLDTYLETRGRPPSAMEGRPRAEDALVAFLAAVFGETTSFVVAEERFERAYAELEAHVYAGRMHMTVLAPLLGVALESDELDLGDGLMLNRADSFHRAPPEAFGSADSGEAGAATFAVYSYDGERAAGSPVVSARNRLRRLLSALRLFEAGSTALAQVAWARSGDGPWRLVPMNAMGRPDRRWQLTAPRERELRAFVELVARRTPHGGELAWALARFEMGLERTPALDALTDHLLALRALLEPEGSASGKLGQRLAVLCAAPEEQGDLALRVAEAVALERSATSGLAQPGPGPDALVHEIAGYARALLRDVICGHLEPDLCGLADEMLAEISAPV
ncbi:MAG: hypothetical protein ACR2K9_08135 [Solirubrobacteraceae bacterium]